MPNIYETALNEWLDKTEWVQQQISTFGPKALGKHRADVMREEIERLRAALAQQEQPVAAQQEAIPLTLNCPECGKLHIDEGEWATRLHKTHQCQYCKHEWRPFEYPTVGIAAHPAQAPQQEAGQARELPPLPADDAHSENVRGLYTADQMREYARAAQSSPAVPGERERLLTQVIPYRLKLIERGECVDASVEAIRECVARLLASAPAQPTVPEGWVSVEERMPPPDKRVLVWFRNVLSNGRTTCAFHAPKHTVNADHWEYGYDEDEQGNTWVPEGWWEDPVEGEECHHISSKVEFWMPIPASPNGIAAAAPVAQEKK